MLELVKLGLRPRLVELEIAAAYVGLSASAFEKGVREGLYPKPIRDGRKPRWDLRALDQVIDRRSGLAPSSPGDESPEAMMRAIDAYDPAA
jgi:predicted DNA-binding transcriptional regulator AlpA